MYPAMRKPPVNLLNLLKRQVQGQLNKNTKSFSTKSTTREFEEIRISVPWGHLAAKWYGPRDKRPIVGFHGWQDNAGTFDTLAPLLPPNIGFLAVDMPGHGLSSWLPKGCTYHMLDHINIYYHLIRTFKWDKISMICHSMSAADGLVFTSLFPNKCDMFVNLDFVQPLLGKKQLSINWMTNQVVEQNKFIDESRQMATQPSYGMDELIARMRKANRDAILEERYDIILKRNIRPSEDDPNKYYLTRDGRLKAMVFTYFAPDVLVEMAHRIKCPHLYIRNQHSKRYDSDEELKDVLGAFRKNPDYQFCLVEGNHYTHLNEPETIAKIVNPFIEKYRREDIFEIKEKIA